MHYFSQKGLGEALSMLGQLLLDRKECYEVVAIGGGGLLLLGLISRPTRDVDLVACVDEGRLVTASPLPKSLASAIGEVGIALGCGKSWMNSEPSQLFEMGLPVGFQTRWRTMQHGGLIIHLAGRFDQICFKLYAAVDQGPESKHFADLKLLKPSKDELEEAEKWCKTHDVSEEFAALLQDVKIALGS
jgi:hypothetical protein